LPITIKDFNKDYSALLAVSSIDNVMQYYDLFKEERSRRTRFAYCYYFTYGSNEDSDEANDSLPG
jgi:type I restriction enzyme R subunit